MRDERHLAAATCVQLLDQILLFSWNFTFRQLKLHTENIRKLQPAELVWGSRAPSVGTSDIFPSLLFFIGIIRIRSVYMIFEDIHVIYI